MKRIVLIVITCISIISCGGGGGGGVGPSEPASLSTEPPPTNPTNIKRGIFTDGPVEGLKYKQGSLNGITNALGEFEYDANSSIPVTFFVGSIELGSAMGGDVITPYDLSVGGKSNSLQSGFNISRFLLSMDIEPEQNIQLPASDGLVGEFDFSTTTETFEQNETLNALVKIYGSGELESVSSTEMHLALNPAIAESKLKLNADLKQAITDIQFTWDASFQGSGVLLKAESNDQSLFVIEANVDDESGSLSLTRISLFYDKGSYLVFDVNNVIEPTLVSRSGSVKLFANLAYMDIARLLRLETFSPTKEGALMDDSGYQGRIKLPPVSNNIRLEIIELLEKYNVEGFSETDAFKLAQKMLSIAELLACGDVETICSIDLAKAFTYSLENDPYFSEVVSVHEGSVEQFCVPVDVGISAISSCGSYLYQADFSDLVGVQFVNSRISSPQTKLISSEVYFLLFDLYDPSIGYEIYTCDVDFFMEVYGSYVQYSSSGNYSCYWGSFPDEEFPSDWQQKRAAMELFVDRYLNNFLELLEPAPSNFPYLEFISYLSVSTPRNLGANSWYELYQGGTESFTDSFDHYYSISETVDAEGLNLYLSTYKGEYGGNILDNNTFPLLHWSLKSGLIGVSGEYVLKHGPTELFFRIQFVDAEEAIPIDI